MDRVTRGKDAIDVGFTGKAASSAEQLLDGEPLAALGSASGQHITAILGGHPLQEAVHALARDALRLPGPFHNLASIAALALNLEGEVLGMRKVLDPFLERLAGCQLDQAGSAAVTTDLAVVTLGDAPGVAAIAQLQDDLSHCGKAWYQKLDKDGSALYC